MLLEPINTAILIFTRTAKSEARHKCFQNHLGFRQNKAIAKLLIQKTITTIKATTLPYFIVDDLQQQGDNFNERLTNATQYVYGKGFNHVIIIGNDCPNLTPNAILVAYQQLQKNQLVIGPCKDGGVYLIGIQQAYFDENQFLKLPWLTNQLAQAFVAYSNQLVFQLPLQIDIDEANDLRDFLQSIPSTNPLKIQLKRLLGQISRLQAIFQKRIIYRFLYLPFGLRAPPSFSYN